jgi:flagellar export protein FliJ
MSTFHFRLETLLRLRMAERDERRADLAKALRAEQMLRDQQAQIEMEQAQAQAAARAQSAPGAADVDQLLRTSRYQLVLKARGVQLTQQMAQVAVETERRRQAVVEADRQVRVFEKLRERQERAHQERQSRQEVKELDEAAGIAYARRKEVGT